MFERIAKFIASAGVCSRRDAEKLILEGKVKLNGQIINTPAIKVTESDRIEVNGKFLQKQDTIRLWKFYKPTGVITSARDEKGRKIVFDLLPQNFPRVITVGRLDLNSEGLLLLTNSGTLSRALELPSNKFQRVYKVRILGDITQEITQRLKKGVIVEGIKYGSIRVEKIGEKQGANIWIKMSLEEGKNREIRKVLGFFGIRVSRLIRISYHKFVLGNLQRGEIMEVPYNEVKKLLKELEGGIK